jgi:hypothetical protein
MANKLLGKEVSFTANRITVGNPVTGILLKEDKEWATIKLTKTIEGLVNIWYSGVEKQFRKCLMGKMVLTKSKTTSK